jgi:two-component system, OmpR family, alkaline phosphatase synthesis response regulator PhoP
MGKILLLGIKGERLEQLKKNIGNAGHNVITAEFDNSAELLYTKNPDIVVLDLTTRKDIVEAWYQVKQDTTESHKPTLVIVLEDRIRDVELMTGIQDFIMYPFNLIELEMRIKLILGTHKNSDTDEVIKIGNLAIYTTRYEVTVDDWSVVLTLKEYELLKYLVTHKGRVFTREVLLDAIWGYDYYGGTRTVDVHVGRLRTKIENQYSFIKTVRGVGYMFSDEYNDNSS